MSNIKLFFKTYCVDIITLILVFILGVFSKNIVESFFEKVDFFESQITVLSPENNSIINQSYNVDFNFSTNENSLARFLV